MNAQLSQLTPCGHNMHSEDLPRVPVENFRNRKAVSVREKLFAKLKSCVAISESHVLHKILSSQRVSDIKFSTK